MPEIPPLNIFLQIKYVCTYFKIHNYFIEHPYKPNMTICIVLTIADFLNASEDIFNHIDSLFHPGCSFDII